MSFETDANSNLKSLEESERAALIEKVKNNLEELLLSEHLSEDEKASVIHEALKIIGSSEGEIQR